MSPLPRSPLIAWVRRAVGIAFVLPFVSLGWSALCAAASQDRSVSDLLSIEQWKSLDGATDRGLEFLSKHQLANGSFEGPDRAQPGITSLCVMAFLSRGHIPRDGTYGSQIDRAVDFVLTCQQPDGFLFDPSIRHWHEGTYNHAIAGLMLAEVYGMTQAEQRDRVRTAIRKAIEFTRAQQLLPKTPNEAGGWRYFEEATRESDISATSWQIMFLRSARNAEFEVPKEYIDQAMGYVRRTFSREMGAFRYQARNGSPISRATAGSGIVMLALGGEHETEMAQTAGKWILNNSFRQYNNRAGGYDRYHYSAYYCSQAMFQLGGEYWRKFYPPLMEVLMKHQHGDGSWDPESVSDTNKGNVYTTALAILALTPPYQLLPIYQR